MLCNVFVKALCETCKKTSRLIVLAPNNSIHATGNHQHPENRAWLRINHFTRTFQWIMFAGNKFAFAEISWHTMHFQTWVIFVTKGSTFLEEKRFNRFCIYESGKTSSRCTLSKYLLVDSFKCWSSMFNLNEMPSLASSRLNLSLIQVEGSDIWGIYYALLEFVDTVEPCEDVSKLLYKFLKLFYISSPWNLEKIHYGSKKTWVPKGLKRFHCINKNSDSKPH